MNGTDSPRSLRLLVVPFLLLAGCSPLARLELVFAYTGAPLDPAFFRLTGKKACPPAAISAAAPAAPGAPASGDDVEWQTLEVQAGGLRVVSAFRGVRCRVRVTGFYDMNRDGAVNIGDLTVTSPEIEVADRGLFRGNLTTAAALRLVPIP